MDTFGKLRGTEGDVLSGHFTVFYGDVPPFGPCLRFLEYIGGGHQPILSIVYGVIWLETPLVYTCSGQRNAS